MRRKIIGLVLSLSVVAWTLAQPSPVAAQPADSYQVTGVTVEQRGESINAARSAAFDAGQQQAFRQLLEQLAVPSGVVDPDAVTIDTISELVASTRVENETTTAGVYRATLSIDFRPDAVRAFLGNRDAAFTERTGQPVVLLPVFIGETGARLWQGDNPWHAAWRGLDAGTAFSLVVPPGDIDDLSTIRAEAAMAGETSALERLAERYGAGGSVVAVAEPGSTGVTVVLNRYYGGDRDVEVLRVSGDPSSLETFEEAAREVGAFIHENWPLETVTPSGPERTLFVRVPLQSADEWFDIQARLNRMTNLDEARVVRMAPREVVLEVTYFGSAEQLREAAARERLRLDDAGGDQPGQPAEGVAILRRGG